MQNDAFWKEKEEKREGKGVLDNKMIIFAAL